MSTFERLSIAIAIIIVVILAAASGGFFMGKRTENTNRMKADNTAF